LVTSTAVDDGSPPARGGPSAHDEIIGRGRPLASHEDRRALALLRADGNTDLRRTLQELGDIARRGSAAIIITPTAEANWLPQLAHLARRGLESHVLLLDRPSFGGEGNSEALRAAIALLGFRGHVVRRGELGRPLVEDERHGYWEFMVTGTGRAVAVRRPLDH